MKQARPAGRPGFTLIEIVITIVIATIALYSLLTVFITATARNVDQEAVSMAMYLANAKLEVVSNNKFGYISAEALTSVGTGFADFLSEVAVNYVAADDLDTPQPAATDYKKITVKITSMNSPGLTLEVSGLATNISND